MEPFINIRITRKGKALVSKYTSPACGGIAHEREEEEEEEEEAQ